MIAWSSHVGPSYAAWRSISTERALAVWVPVTACPEVVAAKNNDDAARRYLGRLQPAEFGVVHATVDGVDHHPGAVGDLVDQSDADHLADQRCLARPALEQRHGRCAAVDAGLLQSPLHHFELVGAVTELA